MIYLPHTPPTTPAGLADGTEPDSPPRAPEAPTFTSLLLLVPLPGILFCSCPRSDSSHCPAPWPLPSSLPFQLEKRLFFLCMRNPHFILSIHKCKQVRSRRGSNKIPPSPFQLAHIYDQLAVCFSDVFTFRRVCL